MDQQNLDSATVFYIYLKWQKLVVYFGLSSCFTACPSDLVVSLKIFSQHITILNSLNIIILALRNNSRVNANALLLNFSISLGIACSFKTV